MQTCEKEWETANAYESVTSMVTQCINDDKLTIGKLIRSEQKPYVIATISEAVAFYNSMLPSQRALSVQGIINIATTFTDHPDMKHLSLSELKTFFNLAFKQQKFGKLYGGFGYDTLLDWFNLFFEERMQETIRYRENQHVQQTMYEKQRRTRSEGDAFGSIGSVIKGGQNGE